MNTDWTKTMLAACISCMLTGTAAWFTFGQNKVTRPEMVQYIAEHDLVAVESDKLVALRLDKNDAGDVELRGLVKDLTKEQQAVVLELRSFIVEMRAAKQ